MWGPDDCIFCGNEVKLYTYEYRCRVCGWYDQDKTELFRKGVTFKKSEVKYIDNIIDIKLELTNSNVDKLHRQLNVKLKEQDKIIKAMSILLVQRGIIDDINEINKIIDSIDVLNKLENKE